MSVSREQSLNLTVMHLIYSFAPVFIVVWHQFMWTSEIMNLNLVLREIMSEQFT